MIIGIGIDLVQNSRISQALKRHRFNFLKKILTEREISKENQNKVSVQHLAGVFAAKEAVIKSLSTFLGYSLNFQEIIVQKNKDGTPIISISSNKSKEKLSNIKITISISHEQDYSTALSVAESLP